MYEAIAGVVSAILRAVIGIFVLFTFAVSAAIRLGIIIETTLSITAIHQLPKQAVSAVNALTFTEFVSIACIDAVHSFRAFAVVHTCVELLATRFDQAIPSGISGG